MLIGQLGALHFGRFLLWCAPPSALALAFAYLIIKKVYRGDFRVRTLPVAVPQQEGPPLDTHQSMKGGLAAAVLIGLFFTSVPRELSAICVAGVLLCSRSMHTRSILGLVDWHLITLFCGLFIIVKGLETTGVPAVTISCFESHGLTVGNPLMLTAISGTLSCLVSNVPATMFLTRFLNPANPVQWYVLALSSTFAGNLITIGSIANLITFEQAKVLGIEIGFREHARIGVPVTILSLIIAVAWISTATRIIPVQ
jgi:Na+/H+ antiporter NhaD/arsenite permease-like protein